MTYKIRSMNDGATPVLGDWALCPGVKHRSTPRRVKGDFDQ
jgi:hypothetical protein